MATRSSESESVWGQGKQVLKFEPKNRALPNRPLNYNLEVLGRLAPVEFNLQACGTSNYLQTPFYS